MPVTTRYQHRTDLYMSVLEQPLLLENILSHLSAADAVHLKMTGGSLVHEPRFQDTVDVFLESEYEDHQLQLFLRTMNEKLNDVYRETRAIDQYRKLNELYDYLLDHRYYIDSLEPCWSSFRDMLERRLIRDLENVDYEMYALFYLGEFFGTQVQAFNDDRGELVEYIRDRHGNMHIL
jgi:hypothetical protein